MTFTIDAPALPALDDPCMSCGGTGVIPSYAWDRWLSRNAAARADFEAVHADEDWYRSPEHGELDNEQPGEPYDFGCADCGGTGRKPTDAGRALLRFMREHTGVAG